MERADTRLAELGSSVRELLAVEGSASREIREARAEFLEQIVARNAAPSRGRRRWHVLLLGAGVGALALGGWAWARGPITFQVGTAGMAGRAGDLVEAAEGAEAPLRFSDGSSLTLREGGRLRVLATEAKGARILVEDGVVEARVAKPRLGGKRWRFEAGPFSVEVTGTRFELSYRAVDQGFALATLEGQVVVSGACLNGPTPVNAGSRLALSCLSELFASSPPRPLPEAAAAQAAPKAVELALTTAPAKALPSWRELLAAGRLKEGVRAAERAGFDGVCQSATRKELLLLADAARLFDRVPRALTALRILRTRFPASPEAATAAFTLGRIAFEQRHAYADAVHWFGSYLRERPSGPLMGDAVGRLMEARLRAGDRTGARADADRYLRRFPEGPYAAQARGILSL